MLLRHCLHGKKLARCVLLRETETELLTVISGCMQVDCMSTGVERLVGSQSRLYVT